MLKMYTKRKSSRCNACGIWHMYSLNAALKEILVWYAGLMHAVFMCMCVHILY